MPTIFLGFMEGKRIEMPRVGRFLDIHFLESGEKIIIGVNMYAISNLSAGNMTQTNYSLEKIFFIVVYVK